MEGDQEGGRGMGAGLGVEEAAVLWVKLEEMEVKRRKQVLTTRTRLTEGCRKEEA